MAATARSVHRDGQDQWETVGDDRRGGGFPVMDPSKRGSPSRHSMDWGGSSRRSRIPNAQPASPSSCSLCFRVWSHSSWLTRTSILEPVPPVAQATVVGVHEGSTRSPDTWVTVEFVPEGGRVVRADVTQFSWDPTPRVGDAARVRYDPTDPTVYVRDDRVGPAVFWPICLALFAVGLLALGVAGWRRRLPPALRQRH